jgi:hypothetical protein
MFELMSPHDVVVSIDDADNPAHHAVPSHDAGLKISFGVTNVGSKAGIARVGIEIDDKFFKEWKSPSLAPGQGVSTLVSIGRLSQGEHTVLIYVNPGSGNFDHATNTFQVQ